MTTTAHRIQSPTLLATAALIGVTGLSALAGPAASGRAAPDHRAGRSHVVEVSVDSTHIAAPHRLRPGITTFHTTSTHAGTDSLAVVRLHRGVTYAQISGYLQHGDLAAVFRHVTGKGGIAHGGPHNGRSWTTNLHRGRHLFVDDEANLFARFIVKGRRTRAPRPRADRTITFDHGTFKLPRRCGDGTYLLHNDDTIQHELGWVRILGDHTRRDVERVLAAGTHPNWLEPQATM
ncbi:MAG: hypothetical protein QOK15_2844, partial [Nocardioidaceae bacterium]|nr:hypothetical protein [Nocardioidaceae bacterium]